MILDKAMRSMLKDYGLRIVLPEALEDILGPKIVPHIRMCMDDVRLEGSPGVPLAAIGSTNEHILTRHFDLLLDAVIARLRLLATSDLTGLTAVQLVQGGFVDPVRVFVKNEPHTKVKAEKKRWRIISSVSLVDQIVERVLHRHINQTEILNWHSIPSKPGVGFDDESVGLMIDYVNNRIRVPAESDISGFDWSLKGWNFDFDAEFRLRLHSTDVTNTVYAKAVRNRHYCLSLSVFQLSDGRMFAQQARGIQLSGSYLTSSTNSHCRVSIAKTVYQVLYYRNGVEGDDEATANGDDGVEEYMDGAESVYNELGYPLKFYKKCEGNRFEFCSHVYDTKRRTAYALNHGKETMKLMHRKDLNTNDEKRLAIMQYYDDLRGSPHIEEMLDIIERAAWYTSSG